MDAAKGRKAPRDLIDEALLEVARAKTARSPESDLARRQAAEKVWGYVASELNQTFRDSRMPVEEGRHSHEQREGWLKKLDGELGTRFIERHRVYKEDLHGDCFYEGKCPMPDVLASHAEAAKQFVQEVREAVKEVKRRG